MIRPGVALPAELDLGNGLDIGPNRDAFDLDRVLAEPADASRRAPLGSEWPTVGTVRPEWIVLRAVSEAIEEVRLKSDLHALGEEKASG